MAEVTMTLEEYQDLEDKLSTLARENHNLKQERDGFRKQRDELINDMAEVKRKAEAFDEIKVIINRQDVYDETIVLEVEDVVFFCETDISGGSSDGHY